MQYLINITQQEFVSVQDRRISRFKKHLTSIQIDGSFTSDSQLLNRRREPCSLYYFSVFYVIFFKELFSCCIRTYFLKADAKGYTFFTYSKCFEKKVSFL